MVFSAMSKTVANSLISPSVFAQITVSGGIEPSFYRDFYCLDYSKLRGRCIVLITSTSILITLCYEMIINENADFYKPGYSTAQRSYVQNAQNHNTRHDDRDGQIVLPGKLFLQEYPAPEN